MAALREVKTPQFWDENYEVAGNRQSFLTIPRHKHRPKIVTEWRHFRGRRWHWDTYFDHS